MQMCIWGKKKKKQQLWIQSDRKVIWENKESMYKEAVQKEVGFKISSLSKI